MKYHCLQLESDDCGFACLKMMLAHNSKNRDYLRLIQQEKHGAYSMRDLCEEGQKFHLVLEGYEIDGYDRLRFPCILLVKIKDAKHYILLEKIKRNRVFFFDPTFGEACLPLERLEEISERKVLMAEPSAVFIPERRKTNGFGSCGTVIFLFFQLLAFFLFSFENGEFHVSFLWIFLLFLFAYLGGKLHLYRSMKRYDSEVIYPILAYSSDEKILDGEYALKRDLFIYHQKIIATAVMFGFSLFVLLVNDGWNAIPIAFLSVSEIFRRSILRRETSPSVLQYFHEDVPTADERAYRYVKKDEFLKFAQLFFLGLILIAQCALNRRFTYFVYYFFLCQFFASEWEKMLNLSREKLILDRNADICAMKRKNICQSGEGVVK